MNLPPTALRLLPIAPLLLIAVTLGACKSYQLGSPTELPFESIYIRPVSNQSFAPQAQALLSTQVREAFLRDGRVRLVADEADADAVLTIGLTQYNRRAGARQSGDTAVARELVLGLSAQTSLYDTNRGRYHFQGRQVDEQSNAYGDDPYANPALPQTQGFLQSEYQAMPRLTRGLAQKIADEVLSPWPENTVR
jgi:hypothetical protein